MRNCLYDCGSLNFILSNKIVYIYLIWFDKIKFSKRPNVENSMYLRLCRWITVWSGAVVNPLCLARDPEWGVYQDGVSEYKSYIYGAEYETAGSSMGSVHNYNVPCVVCLRQNKSVVKMFPGEVPTLNKMSLIIINQ